MAMKTTTIFLALLLSGLFAVGQTLHQAETFELNTPPPPGSNIYEASEYIENNTGFYYPSVADEFFEERINPFMIIPPESGETGPNPGDEFYVGNLNGNFSVSPTGAATYEIPLIFPPGLSSMSPDLSLAYNSQGSDGYLGEKWTIGGLSSISRTASTPYYNDGYSDPITFDQHDQLILDGQRLINVESLIYRTEIDGMSNIVYNVENDYFTVYTKSGLIKEYGKTSDSKQFLQSQDKPLSWSISKIKDRLGNYISFQYYNYPVTGEIYIKSIKYTGNDEQSIIIEPFMEIEFNYTDRAHNLTNSKKYFSDGTVGGNGYFAQITKILDEINCYYNDDPVKSYDLTYLDYPYSFNGIGNKLTSITEISSNGKKIKSTEFQWDVWEPTFFPYAYLDKKEEFLYGGWFDGIPGSSGDFTGDGKDEIVVIRTDPLYTDYIVTSPDNSSYQSFRIFSSELDYRGYAVGDFNGDGLKDITFANYVGSGSEHAVNFITCISYIDENGTLNFNKVQNNCEIDIGFQNNTPLLLTGDFNGDGIDDLFTRNSTSGSHLFMGSNSNPLVNESIATINQTIQIPALLKPGDFDGDGKTELLSIYSMNGVNITRLAGLNANNTVMDIHPSNHHFDMTKEILAGDFNGDGKMDIIQVNNGGEWMLSCSFGQGFADETNVAGIGLDDLNNHTVSVTLDVNGDGKTDIISIDDYDTNTDIITAYYMDISSQEMISNDGSLQADKTENICVGSFFGEAKQQLFQVGSNPLNSCYCGEFDRESQLITKITNGFGRNIHLTYETLQKKLNNLPIEIPAFPFALFTAPIHITTKVEYDNGNGDEKFLPTEYVYQGARRHINGKGYVGFEKMDIFNYKDNNLTRTEFDLYISNNKYYYAYPKLVEQYILDDGEIGSLVSKNEITDFTHINTVPGNSKIFIPYAQTTITKNFEIDENNTLKNTKKATKSLDIYGNTTNLNIYQGKTEWSLLYSENIVNTYDNYPDDWIFGRLNQVEVTKNAPGTSQVVRKSKFGYYGNETKWYGQLKWEELEPDNLNAIKTEYVYDDYGNILSSTVSSSNPNNTNPTLSRSTTTTFSADYDYRFATTSTNALNHSITKVYDPIWGNLTKVVDRNGFETNYLYDDFGRLKETILPDKNKAVKVQRWVQAGDEDAPVIGSPVYYVWSKATGKPVKKAYYDKLNRELRTVTEGFDGRKIYINNYYNNTGQLSAVSEPYFAGETEILGTIDYDDLNRIITKSAPGENGDRITSYAYKADANYTEKWVTNPNNQTTINRYNPTGLLIETEDNAGNIVKYNYTSEGLIEDMYIDNIPETANIHKEYDILGNCISISDPALGLKEYKFNAYGELLEVKHNNIVKVEYTSNDYDLLGRLVHKNEPGVGETWINYDSQLLGMMDNERFVDISNNIFNSTHTYDELGRTIEKRETINGSDVQEDFTTQYSYNEHNQLMDMVYPSNFAIRNIYSSRGYLSKVVRKSDSKVVWEAIEMNARLQLEKYNLGNGLQTMKNYHQNSGYLENKTTYEPGLNMRLIYNQEYSWDNIGNLLSRFEDRNSSILSETFNYDNLNRLEEIILQNGNNETITTYLDYDYLGRIKEKSSTHTSFHVANNYFYNNPNNPYELTSLDNKPPGIGTEGRDIAYTPFDKVYHIEEGNGLKEISIRYGLGHSRKVFDYIENEELIKRKIYVGGYYEKVIENGTINEVHYITGGDGIFAVYTEKSDNENTFLYVHSDHLGSIICLTDENSTVVDEFSYDAWGNKRDLVNGYPVFTLGSSNTDRGFTGHEHIDVFSLVNMNGRMFDPITSYFLSPDPLQITPTNSQEFNPYVYCVNNPLSLVDPSGYSWFSDT
jgi:RHS repeat-associated protein